MEIPVEKLIEIIIKEVIAQLTKSDVKIKFSLNKSTLVPPTENLIRKEIDMRGYRTPVLTEDHLTEINPGTTEIVIPKGTVITPGARYLIKNRNLKLINK